MLMKIKVVIFDFDGVFTDNKVYVNEKGEESIVCDKADGVGLSMLDKAGILAAVLSSERNTAVYARCHKLGLACVTGSKDKLNDLMKCLGKVHVLPQEVAYAGNDLADIPCMKYVGLPIAVANAVEDVKLVAKKITARCGGDGAVREICEKITSGSW